MKPSGNTSPTQRNDYLTDTEVYEEDNPQTTNQVHLISHHPSNPSENRSKQGLPLAKGSTAYFTE
jgi:hypothetical protein